MENVETQPVTMRTPFPARLISKLPKPTKTQTDDVKANFKAGARCAICGGWHHPNVVHLDYVGHAALTDRLLDVDPGWTWEPVAMDMGGLPALDKDGGLWIKLTVNGVTRYGYGDAQGKTGGDAMKERIGDALRNAAMRFGAALDLWHKGDLHADDPTDPTTTAPSPKSATKQTQKCTTELLATFCKDVVDPETGEVKRFGWKSLVETGQKNAEDLIAFLSTKYEFSSEQLILIRSWQAARSD